MLYKVNFGSVLLCLSLLLGCAFTIGCNSDDEIKGPTTSLSEPFTANFRGTVLDSDGASIEGATVILGTDRVISDANGYWVADDVPMPAGPSYIRFEADGYMHGSKTVFAYDERTYEVQVQLLPSTAIAVVETALGGVAEFDGASLVLPSGALVREDGSSFEGTYEVSAHYLDPTSDAMLEQMPGDLRAIRSEAEGGEETLLVSYGMVAVELSSRGEKLNLRDGASAELTFPIPLEARRSAPATIPLWYFDEVEGIWTEEGFAERVGNNYVGEVTHFSFWNCDIPTDYAEVCINLSIESQNLAGLDTTIADNWLVVIASQDWGVTTGYTDENGRVCGYVPANEVLTLTINDPCGEPMFVTTIGPFAAIGQAGGATSVVEIDLVSPPQSSRLNIFEGRALCNGLPVSNGFVSIIQDNRILGVEQTDSNGDFLIAVTSCDTDSLEITFRDLDALLQSDLTVAFAPGIRSLGDVEVCENTLVNFVKINVEGQPAWFTPDFSVQVLQGDTLHMWIRPTQSNPGMRFVVDLRADDTSQIGVGDFNLSQRGYLEVEYPTTPAATQMQFFLGGGIFRIHEYELLPSGATKLRCEMLPVTLTDTQSNQALEVGFELSAGF